MKLKNLLFTFFFPLIIGFFFIAGTSNEGGSPGGKTGSPGDGSNCTSCHSGTLIAQNDWISTNIPVNGYTPGNVYTITLTGTHTGVVKFGFELTAETNSNNKTGTFIITNNAETKLINNDCAVTHKSDGITPAGNSKTWSFNWTAPTSGTGEVTFYAALNAANGNGSTSGDIIYGTTLAVNENNTGTTSLVDDEIKIFPSLVSDYINIHMIKNSIPVNYKIININGQIICNGELQSENTIINLQLLPKGIYFINIQLQSNNKITKFIKN